MVLAQAQRAAGFVAGEEREALADCRRQRSHRAGGPWLIVESDGSMVRTGELALDPAGGASPGGRAKRLRRTHWREVRLSLVAVPGQSPRRRYAAAMGPPQRAGEQMFALALGSGYGDNTGSTQWATEPLGLPSKWRRSSPDSAFCWTATTFWNTCTRGPQPSSQRMPQQRSIGSATRRTALTGARWPWWWRNAGAWRPVPGSRSSVWLAIWKTGTTSWIMPQPKGVVFPWGAARWKVGIAM